MERVYTSYWASGHQVKLLDASEQLSAITVENVRVIINESQKEVLASSMKKANITNVAYNSPNHEVVITLSDSTPPITLGDKVTIKIDMGNDLRDIAGSCIIEDIADTGLPAEKANGLCGILDDGDFIVDDSIDPGSQHSGEYKIGDIIKPTIYDESSGTLSVAKTVSATATDLKYDELYHKISGVTAYIQWEAGRYYRVTGIHDVYNQDGTEVVMQIFTYEELAPANITELLKEAAGRAIKATSSEYAAFKTDMQSKIANILTPISE